MVVKVRLDFLPTRCEAIRFIKIIQSEGDQQTGRYNIPFLTGVQRHLEKDGPPIFLILWFATAASATPPDDPTKPAQELCSSRLYGFLRMAGLFCCGGGGSAARHH
jgi:hypothetical protein